MYKGVVETSELNMTDDDRDPSVDPWSTVKECGVMIARLIAAGLLRDERVAGLWVVLVAFEHYLLEQMTSVVARAVTPPGWLAEGGCSCLSVCRRRVGRWRAGASSVRR
jgi:hypothetical protein